MPKFSIITCISDPDIYEKCVLRSVSAVRAGYDIELIPVLNLEGLYSAPLALNVGIDASKSDYLIICHQDIKLLTDDWFGRLYSIIDKIEDEWAIIGCAGISLEFSRKDIGPWGGAIEEDTVAVGTLWDDDNLDMPPYWDGIKSVTKCHCVDECLFIMRKSTGLRFDPIFNGFHFYGVDMCLQARAAGLAVYGADLPLIHYGKYSASLSNDTRYWLYLSRLKEKWRYQFAELLGTHMHWTDEELTSYIPVGLKSDDGCNLIVKSMGIKDYSIGEINDQERMPSAPTVS